MSLKGLKTAIDPHSYNLITSTLKKIFRNVIENPTNEKFYKIRTDSATFKNYFEMSNHAINCLREFGYAKIDADDKDSNLYLDYRTSIADLRKLENDFLAAICALE